MPGREVGSRAPPVVVCAVLQTGPTLDAGRPTNRGNVAKP